MLESPTVVKSGNSYAASYGNDANLYAEFSLEPVLNEFQTEEQGKQVFEDYEFVTIITPGNNKSTFKTRATDEYKRRFPKQYEAFKSQNEQAHDGLPLTEWPVVGKAQALNLKVRNIHTVEQLAEIPDSSLDSLGLGGRELRDKAKSYLARAVDASEVTRLISRIEKLETDLRAAREQGSAAPKEASPTIDVKQEMLNTLKLKKG